MMDSVHISTTSKGIDYWQTRPYLSDEVQGNLIGAAIILVPWENYKGEEIVFPAGTSSFVRYLDKKLPQEGLTYEIGIEDADYQELSLHADWVLIADLVVKMAVAPIVASIIAAYIYDMLGKRRADKATVKSKLTIELEGDRKSVDIDYHGPAKTYEEAVNAALRTIALDENLEDVESDDADN
jgi:hypothetical protein